MHLMLSLLIKHIEHKAILKQPDMQLSLVEVATILAEQSSAMASAATIGAISDLVRHLKRTFHVTLGSKDLELVKWNEKFRNVIDECLIQLSKKVLLLLSVQKFYDSFLLQYKCATSIYFLTTPTPPHICTMHVRLIRTVVLIRYLMLGQSLT